MVRSHIRTCAAAVVAIGLVAGSTGASAETAVPSAVTADSAGALAQTIDAELRQWFPSAGTYQWEGQVKASAAGDHFDVDLPSLGIVSGDGSRLGVGVIKLALTPDPDGSLGVGITVPSQIRLLAADGSPDGDFTIGSQHFFGRWLPTLGTFVKLDGSYGDLRAESRKDSSRLAIGSITVSTDLTEAPAGHWTGPSALIIDKLDMIDEHGTPVVHLGSAAVEGTVSGMDLARAVTLGDQLAEEGVAGTVGTAATPGTAKEPANAGDLKVGKEGDDAKAGKEEVGKEGHEDAKVSQDDREDAKASWAELHRELISFQGLFSGASGKVRVNDLMVKTGADGGTVTLGQLVMHGSVDGLDQDKATIALGYDQDGFKMVPNPAPQDFLPEKVEVRLGASDLPLRSLVQRLIDATASYDDKMLEEIGQQLAHTFIDAGSRLRIETLRIDTPVAAAKLEGEARLDPKTALGAVAGFEMVVRGLDVLAKQIQPAPGAKGDDESQNLAAGVAMLQVMGAPGKDESGRDVRTYKLKLGADGKVLLNGADLSAMLQMNQPQGEAPPALGAPSGQPGVRAIKPAAP